MASFPSPSASPEETKTKLVALLQPVVLALLGLAGIARKAHWNVKGIAFTELHGLFGDLYGAASDQADILAEHCTLVLGIPIEGDHVDAAEGAGITRMPATLTQGRDLARAVGERVTQVDALITMQKPALLALGDENAQQKCIDASIAIMGIAGKILAHLG